MKANGVVFARVLDLHFRVIVHFFEAFVLMLRNTICSKWVILLHISVPYITLEFDIVGDSSLLPLFFKIFGNMPMF